MSSHQLPSQYQSYIHLSRYSRWIESENRRESWEETVARYCNFFREKHGDLFPYQMIYDAILNLEVMPSMRSLMTAGEALTKDNISGYNCSFISVDDIRAFDEILYILMNGTGVGFSVERQSIAKLPAIGLSIKDGTAFLADAMIETDDCIVVEDSKEGWAAAFRTLIAELYSARIPKWDTSKVRPAGTRLKTFGGRASGPKPLIDLFKFSVSMFKNAVGRRLTSVECHDLVCKIADIVVVGGVRRSALISLSNLSDDRMRSAKTGQWWLNDPHRALANNSAVYTERPSAEIFMREWLSLIESKAGERGIFSLASAHKKGAENGRRVAELIAGTNPCGEILLRSAGFCNLTEVIVRADDTMESLKRKAGIATVMGTFQSAMTDFKYVRDIWRQNAEEERLLGVSMTGIMDHPFLSTTACGEALREVRDHTIEVNKIWAGLLGINQSAAITTVKPSGTVSQLVDSASGIHPRYAPHYIRTVRADKKDPLAQFMRLRGFPVEDCVMKPETTDVFAFPVASPVGAVYRDERSAIDQLEHYLTFKKNWCEHNPSITVYVRDHEWMQVGAWVFDNFEEVGGVSFLPHSNHSYAQAPYQECSKAEYDAVVAQMPSVSWDELRTFETQDGTTNTRDLACSAGVCEFI